MLKVYIAKSSSFTLGSKVNCEIFALGPDNAIAGVLVCAPEIIAMPPPKADIQGRLKVASTMYAITMKSSYILVQTYNVQLQLLACTDPPLLCFSRMLKSAYKLRHLRGSYSQ